MVAILPLILKWEKIYNKNNRSVCNISLPIAQRTQFSIKNTPLKATFLKIT